MFNVVGGLRSPLLLGASPPGGGGAFPPVALASAVIICIELPIESDKNVISDESPDNFLFHQVCPGLIIFLINQLLDRS